MSMSEEIKAVKAALLKFAEIFEKQGKYGSTSV